MVEPVDVLEGGVLDLVPVLPWSPLSDEFDAPMIVKSVMGPVGGLGAFSALKNERIPAIARYVLLPSNCESSSIAAWPSVPRSGSNSWVTIAVMSCVVCARTPRSSWAGPSSSSCAGNLVESSTRSGPTICDSADLTQASNSRVSAACSFGRSDATARCRRARAARSRSTALSDANNPRASLLLTTTSRPVRCRRTPLSAERRRRLLPLHR